MHRCVNAKQRSEQLPGCEVCEQKGKWSPYGEGLLKRKGDLLRRSFPRAHVCGAARAKVNCEMPTNEGSKTQSVAKIEGLSGLLGLGKPSVAGGLEGQVPEKSLLGYVVSARSVACNKNIQIGELRDASNRGRQKIVSQRRLCGKDVDETQMSSWKRHRG
jgi:hypothetical protein